MGQDEYIDTKTRQIPENESGGAVGGRRLTGSGFGGHFTWIVKTVHLSEMGAESGVLCRRFSAPLHTHARQGFNSEPLPFSALNLNFR